MPAGSRRVEARHRPQDNRLEIVLLKQALDQLDKLSASQLILLSRTEAIERQCKAILVGVARIEEGVDDVTPELEAAIRQVARQAKTIDQQVPDKCEN